MRRVFFEELIICYIFIHFGLIFFSRMGEFVVELYWRHAPNTCRNFAELARRGYFNGIKFHRIIKDFMIQGGDPTGTGKTIIPPPLLY